MPDEKQESPESQKAKINSKIAALDLSKLFPDKETLLNAEAGVSNVEEKNEGEIKSVEKESVRDEGGDYDAAVKATQDLAINDASDEVKLESKEEPAKTEETFSAVELEASKSGWVPRNKFNGEEDKWVSAREFVERTKLINKYQNTVKELKHYKKAQEDLLDLLSRRGEKDMEERVVSILEKKRSAISEGDIEAAEKYEQAYGETRQELETFKQLRVKIDSDDKAAVNLKEVQPEVKAFVERNKEWFNTETAENAALCAFATKKDSELMYKYPDWALERRLLEVEKMVKTNYHHMFENPMRERPSAVEGTVVSAKTQSFKSKEIVFDDLPDDAKKIVRNMVRTDRTGKMTRDEYAQELVGSGAVIIN